MLKAELQKTWSRPMILSAFVLVCLAQILYAFINYDPGTRELADAYNSFGGTMDSAWQDHTHIRYDQLWETSTVSAEDLWDSTPEQRAALAAYDYTFFTEMIDNHVDVLTGIYGEQAVEAYADLRTASEKGELVFGASPAGKSMANQYMVAWGTLIFMILLCVDQFSGEKDYGMVPVQSVTKRGRRKLFCAKLLTCQLSALSVWAAANLVYFLALCFFYGCGNLHSVVQDFSFNACPYNWDIGEYLAITLAVGLIASQLTALVVFMLARVSGNTQRSFAFIGGALVLPYLFASLIDHVWLSLWLPCLMDSQWLWNELRLLLIGKGYVPVWVIAGAELGLVAVIASVMLHRFVEKAETVVDT